MDDDPSTPKKDEKSTVVNPSPLNLLDIGLMGEDDETGDDLGVCAIDQIGHGSGQMIGRYMLVRQLGEGGFGTVWLAEQFEPMHREVAIKFIKPGMDSRQVIAKFESERQTLAMMQHPNIAAVLDAGTTKRGLPYFVMELVRGEPITTYCDRHKLDIEARLRLFSRVCGAVQHAHLKAILHRDLKPSNILVEEVDGAPLPKVIDFGIAKAISPTADPASRAKSTFSLTGAVIGTPEYMSPEQASGDMDVDVRSDTYALGAILYELLSGRPPLAGFSLHTLPFDKMLNVISRMEPPKPSTVVCSAPKEASALEVASARQSDPKKLARELHGDLDLIVLKALEKDRDRRYENAATLSEDLIRHLSDKPVSARPPTRLYLLKKLIVRNKGAFVSGAFAITASLGALSSAVWGYVSQQKALRRQLTAESSARMESEKSQRVALFLGNLFKDISLRNNTTITPGALRELLGHANTRRSNELRDQPDTDKGVSISLAETFLELDELATAGALYSNALQRMEQLELTDSAEAADCLYWLAWCRLRSVERLGLSDAGEEPTQLVQRCLEIYSKRLPADDDRVFQAEALLASAHRLHNRPDEAGAVLQSLQSPGLLPKVKSSAAYGWILREQALRYLAAKQYEAALHSLDDARKNLLNSSPSFNQRLRVQADMHGLIAEVHMHSGDWDAAIQNAMAELGDRMGWLGVEDAIDLLRIAEIHLRRDSPTEALAWLKRAIAMARLSGQDVIRETALRKVLSLKASGVLADRQEIANAVAELAGSLLSRYDRSALGAQPDRAILDETATLLTSYLPEVKDHPASHASLLTVQAALHARSGDYTAAAGSLEEATRLSPGDPRLRFRLAVFHAASGHMDAFERIRDEALRQLPTAPNRDEMLWMLRTALLRPDPTHKIPADVCSHLLNSQGNPQPPNAPSENEWEPLLMGMAAYRLGHHDEAQSWLEYVQRTSRGAADPTIPVYCHLFMAMNCHVLHHDDEPRAIVEAQTAYEEQLRRFEGTDSSPSLHDTLSAKLLLNELASLLPAPAHGTVPLSGQ